MNCTAAWSFGVCLWPADHTGPHDTVDLATGNLVTFGTKMDLDTFALKSVIEVRDFKGGVENE
jgi:hypothetical protein